MSDEPTQEMIDAGAEMLRGYDLDGDLRTEVARWVYDAMCYARRPTLADYLAQLGDA